MIIFAQVAFGIGPTGLLFVDAAGIPLDYDHALALLQHLQAYYSKAERQGHEQQSIRLAEDLYPDLFAQAYAEGRKLIVKRPKLVAPRLSRPGVLYAVKASCGHYKIGRTKDLAIRLKHLEIEISSAHAAGSEHRLPIELIHTIEAEDIDTAEAALHERLAPFRLNGEWFDLTETRVESIKAISRIILFDQYGTSTFVMRTVSKAASPGERFFLGL